MTVDAEGYLDNLLVDGQGVREVDGLIITGPIKGLWAPGERRGEDDVVPGRDGELGSQKPLAAFVIEIPIRILGANRGERNDNLHELGQLITGIDNGGLVQLVRRRATNGTSGDYLQTTARGRYLTGLSVDVVNPTTGAASLQYKNLSGGWFNGTRYTYP